MAADYDKIREANIRGYGEFTHHLAFLGKLYSERTHFLFELLQNAEDAGAQKVVFRLKPECLEVLHDGRVFDEADVRGICGVSEGTKADDLTKIGKFGIGFKSVYAYVAAPEIHSGDQHFRIAHYVRPFLAASRPIDPPFTTFFDLPFAAERMNPTQAYREIETALRKFSPTTLLFLRKIEVVIVQIADEEIARVARFLRREETDRVRRLTVESCSATGESEHWLVFHRPLYWAPQINNELRVEVAFRLVPHGSPDRFRVEPIAQSPLVVFFPTEKPTNLGFLIQGPFRTTPARDNVPAADADNAKIVAEAAELTADALRWLRQNDLLGIPVLEAMPIRAEQFPDGEMFHAIYDKVAMVIRDEPVLPTHPIESDAGNFASGTGVRAAGSADLRKLLTSAQLTELLGSSTPVRWLSGDITADKTPQLWKYLRQDIRVEELDAAGLVKRLTVAFLVRQTDAWIAELYVYLAGQRAWLSRFHYGPRDAQTVPFLDKPIIRLDSGEHLPPLAPDGRPVAFLPPEGATDFVCVKRAVVEKKEARNFVAALGFDVPDQCDEILRKVLPKYEVGVFPGPDDYQSDLARIVKALETDSNTKRQNLITKLTDIRFVRAQNAATDAIDWKLPKDVYRRTDELEIYFEGNPTAWFLAAEVERFGDRLGAVGVESKVRINVREPNYNGHVILESKPRAKHRRGLEGFDPDCSVDGLKHALSNPNFKRSEFVWNRLLVPNARCLHGEVQSSSRQTFDPSTKSSITSEIGRLARGSTWIPTQAGTFVRPSDVSLFDLPGEFQRNEQLAGQLNMRLPTAVIADLVKQIGVPPEAVEFFAKNPDAFQEFLLWRRLQQTPPPKATPDENQQPKQPVSSGEATKGPEEETTSDPAPEHRAGSRQPPQSDSRPRPDEGLKAQEWLRTELSAKLDSSIWEVSLGEEATPGDQGRTDILVRSRSDSRAFFIEAKRVEGRKIYWSERQIDTARHHPGCYFIALVEPIGIGAPDTHRVHWLWEPLHQLAVGNRRVQWTWKETAEGEFGFDWQPTAPTPMKQADSFRAVVEISDELLADLEQGFDALEIRINHAVN